MDTPEILKIPYTNENSIFYTMARMNPPTPGHLNIIAQLIKDANARGVTQVYVILSNTNNNNENPIPCPEKIAVLGQVDVSGQADDTTKTMIHELKIQMQSEESNPAKKQMINDTQVYTICTKEGDNMFKPIINIINQRIGVPNINLFVVIGEDREDMVDSITNFFFKWDNIYSIAKDFLPRVDMAEYKQRSSTPEGLNQLLDEVPLSTIVEANAMSASVVRNMVKNKRKDKFDELYSPYLDQAKIDALYSSIQTGLRTLGPNDKPSSKPKPLIYTYPMIKGISTFPVKVEKAPKMERVEKVQKTKASNALDSGVYKTSKRSLYKIPRTTTIPVSPSSENNLLGGSKSKKRGKMGQRRTKKRMKGLTRKNRRITKKIMKGLSTKKKRRTNK